ncbi:hypothetical protein [Tenacibaculum sp. 190524A05c]|uniref:YD repeat-containing protein n=1 Tax=Tenacibaculum platacis TaxID=3137852 RepID=A0ABP1EN56_9FLAO
MIKNHLTRRTIAIFFLLNFLSTLIPYNGIYASNNGPNAPEAASFEPVDVTDMVNFASGDLTYVLPLLNVPSPEGGYPISLAYHAGIAMEQDATWVGLGWNLNPGALNRGVNDYPDDWSHVSVNEFFYDKGYEDEFYEFSVGATLLTTGVTIGVGASWGGNRGFGGSVTFGVKGAFRTTIGYGNGKGFGSGSIGILNFSESSAGLNLGVVGMTYNANTKSTSYNFSAMGISINSNGGSFSVGGGKNDDGSYKPSYGAGFNSSHSSQVLDNDYDLQISTSGFNLDLGVFWIKFGKTRVKYSLFKMKNYMTSGIGYAYNDFIASQPEGDNFIKEGMAMDVHRLTNEGVYGGYGTVVGRALMPSYDSYNASAQGFSTKIEPRLYREATLFDKNQENDDDDEVEGFFMDTDRTLVQNFRLGDGIYFYDVRSLSSFLRDDRTDLTIPNFNGEQLTVDKALSAHTNPTGNFSTDVLPTGEPLKNGFRKRTGSFIKTFTNHEIAYNYNSEGFIEAMKSEDRLKITQKSSNSIGGFQITTIDGRTYHYSLPVYNHERVYKNFKNRNNEDEKFYEKYTTRPFATHWLLTGITGPDYIDVNNDKKLDKDDYGYWVSFDYGKWSDAYGYRIPKEGFKTQYLGENNNERHSYSYGRKEIYYLDAIKTRTHTALFVKGFREDGKSVAVNNFAKNYNGGTFNDSFMKSFQNEKRKDLNHKTGVYHSQSGQEYDFTGYNGNTRISSRETKYSYAEYPINRTLRLEKIVLVKNKDGNSILGNKNSLNANPSTSKGYFHMTKGHTEIKVNGFITFPESVLYDEAPKNQLEGYDIELLNNVLDTNDINDSFISEKSIKTIDLNYDYSLAKTSYNSNDGKLTLKSVQFNGKNDTSTIPPYLFEYSKPYVFYNKDKSDVWGYHKEYPDAWSLNKIITPIGTHIKVDYESDQFKPVNNFPLRFMKDMHFRPNEERNSGRLITAPDNNGEFFIDGREEVGIKVNDFYDIKYFEYFQGSIVSGPRGNTHTVRAKVIQKINETKYKLKLQGSEPYLTGDLHLIYMDLNIDKEHLGGGLRVKDLTVSDDTNSNIYKTSYEYEGGVSSYIPYQQEYNVYLRDMILPPSVMYEKVSQVHYDKNNVAQGKTEYGFEVLGDMKTEYYPVQPGGYDIGLIQSREYTHLKIESKGDVHVVNNIGANLSTVSNYKIKDTQSNLGRILYKTSYNKLNQKVETTKYTYKSDLDGDGEIGVEQESFKSYYKSVNFNNVDCFDINALSYVNYPSVLSSVETKSGNNISNIVQYGKKDFLTGQRLETKNILNISKSIKTEIVPAYKKYTQMGAKVDNETNKNMLVQSAINYKYLVKNNGDLLNPQIDESLTDVNITTWNNVWQYPLNDRTYENSQEVWRKYQSYVWKGASNEDGVLNYIDDFNWNIGATQSNNWLLTSEITKYNQFSQPIEIKDINDNYIATKTGDNYTKILAACNTAYDDMYYSGAEYVDKDNANYFDNGIKALGRTLVTNKDAHTGKYVVDVSRGQKAFEITIPSRNERNTPLKQRFKVSVWVKKGGENNARILVDNVQHNFNSSEKVYAGNWVMLNGYISVPETGANIAITTNLGVIRLDDFRLHTSTSAMKTYVYNDFDELTHISSENGLSTYYIYDNVGRLKETHTELPDKVYGDGSGGFKKASTNSYNYKRNNQ